MYDSYMKNNQKIQIKLTLQNIKTIHNSYTMFSEQLQPNQTKQIRSRRPQIQMQKLSQQIINPKEMIKQLSEKIKVTYRKLQQTYEQSSVKNQNYLLQIYIRVLNQMLDQVVYAQEQVYTVDFQGLRQNKTIDYLTGIQIYRQQCLTLKQKLNMTKNILRKQRHRTSNIFTQMQQLQVLSKKKQEELHILKSYVSIKQKQIDENCNKQKKRDVQTILQMQQSGDKDKDKEKQKDKDNVKQECIMQSNACYSTGMTFFQGNFVNNLTQNKQKSKSSMSTRRQQIKSHRDRFHHSNNRSSNMGINKINFNNKSKQQNINYSISLKSRSQSISSKIKQKKISSSKPKYMINLKQLNLPTQKLQKLGTSLWLYRPSSFRKRRPQQTYTNNTLQLLKNRIKGHSQNLIPAQSTSILQNQLTQKLQTENDLSNI